EQPQLEEKLQREFATEIEQLEARTDLGYRNRVGSALGGEEGDKKLEALNNTPGHGITLPEHLLSQARMLNLSPELHRGAEHVIYSLDEHGKLADSADTIAQALLVPVPLAEEAIAIVRRFEPIGMAAKDLRDRLLMQLDHLGYVRPLTRLLVEHHL